MLLSDYKEWLDLSWPKGSSGQPFFADLATALSWPKAVEIVTGGPEAVLSALGVKAGDYVVVPNLSPRYWTSAAKALGGDVILIDAHPQNWQLDLDMLEMFLMNFSMLNERDELILKKDSRVIRTLVVPHLLGGLCDLERLEFIVRRFNLTMGEDVSQAIGCTWNGRPAGSFGRIGYCDFSRNALLPFGEPVVFFNDPQAAAAAQQSVNVADPMHSLVNHLGRQFIPKIQTILNESRARAQQLREDPTRTWMKLEEACTGNGLATAWLEEEASIPAVNEAKLPPSLYMQPPFDKSLYIRQENWSAIIAEKARVLVS